MKFATPKNIGLSTALGVALIAAGCARNQPDAVVVPSGSSLLVSLDATVNSDEVLAGSSLHGRLVEDVLVDGRAVLRAGDEVTIDVIEAAPAENGEPAVLELELASVRTPEGELDVDAKPIHLVGESSGMSDGEKMAAGAVGGALVGGIAGGGKGAAIGGILGTMTGAVIAVNTQGGAVVLESGQQLLFSTTTELELAASV